MVFSSANQSKHNAACTRLAHSSTSWCGCRRYGLALAASFALLAVLCAPVAMPASMNRSQSTTSTHILIVQDSTHFKVLQALCCVTAVPTAACSSFNPGSLTSEEQQMYVACLRRLPSGLACDHTYTHTVKAAGIAGRLSKLQLQQLRMCMAAGEQLHVEVDGKVFKAEGPDGNKHDVLVLAPNTPKLASSRGLHADMPASPDDYSQSSGPSGIVTTRQATETSGVAGGAVTTDGGAESIAAERRVWLKAAVGNSSSQQLARGWMDIPTLVWDTAPATTAPNSSGSGSRDPNSQQAAVMQELAVLLKQSIYMQNETHWVPRVRRVRAAKDASTDGMQQSAGDQKQQQTLQTFGRQPDREVTNPTPPDTPSGMPKAPPELSNTAPGPNTPLPADSLAALAAVVDKPVVKMEKLPPALWGLDRIDQRDLPLDGTYAYGSSDGPGTGSGVTIYAVDSGVLLTHQEFQSWSLGGGSRASYGYDFVSDDKVAEDCDGHGTHVGATAIGRSVGVAKSARLVAVRVLDCTGSGSISDTVAGLDWVAQHVQHPALVIMSLGVAEGSWSRVLEQAALSLIHDHGISVVVASGNSGTDACKISPARLNEVITVAASNMENKFSASHAYEKDTMYKWSNTGSCVTLFAPGVEIWSACGGTSRCPAVTDDAYTWASGTSMAVPHVAGVAALYLSQHPSATPSQVASALVNAAPWGHIQDSRLRDGTPNRLLYSRGVLTGDAAVEPAVVAAAGSG